MSTPRLKELLRLTTKEEPFNPGPYLELMLEIVAMPQFHEAREKMLARISQSTKLNPESYADQFEELRPGDLQTVIGTLAFMWAVNQLKQDGRI